MRLICRTHSYAAASLSHRFARSPVDALIDLLVGGRLRCQIPIGLNVPPVIRLRIAVIPQRARVMCGGCESTPMCSRIRLCSRPFGPRPGYARPPTNTWRCSTARLSESWPTSRTTESAMPLETSSGRSNSMLPQCCSINLT